MPPEPAAGRGEDEGAREPTQQNTPDRAQNPNASDLLRRSATPPWKRLDWRPVRALRPVSASGYPHRPVSAPSAFQRVEHRPGDDVGRGRRGCRPRTPPLEGPGSSRAADALRVGRRVAQRARRPPPSCGQRVYGMPPLTADVALALACRQRPRARSTGSTAWCRPVVVGMPSAPLCPPSCCQRVYGQPTATTSSRACPHAPCSKYWTRGRRRSGRRPGSRAGCPPLELPPAGVRRWTGRRRGRGCR